MSTALPGNGTNAHGFGPGLYDSKPAQDPTAGVKQLMMTIADRPQAEALFLSSSKEEKGLGRA
ncbi:hypothetical protein FRC14_002872 [Serendipita sp. 396]|nr:hypothetical protein FRC14_002872 [Serendipita sp. 396]KAG8824650.1 hypothetical protein FRC19_001331 [Serendipita sp. 401]